MNLRTDATLPGWALVLPAVMLAAFIAMSLQRGDGEVRLWVLDVGQGDAILLQTPAGHTAVIDGGPGATALNSGVGKHLSFWQNSLDLAILTTPKDDDITGLVDLLARRPVDQIVQTEFTPTTSGQGAWQEAVAQSDADVSMASRGDLISFDNEPDLTLRVLYPPAESAVEGMPLLLKLEYKGTSILLASGLTTHDETLLLSLSDQADLKSDVLLVGQHGSDSATSPRFIATVQPSAAIISVGAGNRTNDPAPEVLQRLTAAGAKIYRTDQNGEIEVALKAGELTITPERDK
jgi:competence protein ComEC